MTHQAVPKPNTHVNNLQFHIATKFIYIIYLKHTARMKTIPGLVLDMAIAIVADAYSMPERYRFIEKASLNISMSIAKKKKVCYEHYILNHTITQVMKQ